MSNKKRIKLTDAQRQHLEEFVEKSESIRKLNRARILLLSDERSLTGGKTDRQIADDLGISIATVARIRHQFVTDGLQAALTDKPRSGRPPRITQTQKAQVVALAHSEPPQGRKRWSLRLLASELVERGVIDTISYKTVGEILKSANSNSP